MKIVVEGCCHGELDKIYEVIGQVQEREGLTVDLLICCGDFQAVRDATDLSSMAVPPKYREMGSFYRYYNGEKTAPVLTIFIGGNHEASNHLWELSHGGWVAPNIYYMGTAGVVQVGGLRIAGLSGIYKEGDYRRGRFERPTFSESTKRSVYHVRSCDVFRLKQLSGRVDIGLSHDWPQGIYHHGNKAQLLRKKAYFADEIAETTLGSPAAMALLQHLRPLYWFSAHLHVKFAAVYRHGDDSESITKFLALDKCLPGRRFMQVLDMPAPSSPPYQLCYDAEWLAILRSTETLMGSSRSLWLPPHPSTDTRVSFTPEEPELKEVKQLFNGDLTIPHNFTPTSTPHTSTPSHYHSVCPRENPQTAVFCQTLGISNRYSPNYNSRGVSRGFHGDSPAADASNPDEITLITSEDDDDDNEGAVPPNSSTTRGTTPPSDTTPSKPRYPWLEGLSGDELDQSPTSQTGLSTDGAGDDEATFSEVQKSLHSEFSDVSRPSAGSCDRSGDLGIGSHDVGEGEIQQSADPDAVPEPDTNPDKIVLDDEAEDDT